MQAFFDIDTQIDFVFPAGALYGAGAERVIPNVATLNRRAVQRGIPLISTMCAHGEDAAEFKIWGPHCVTGTVGQQKPAATLMPAGKQIFIEKDELDLFSNPETEALLDRLNIGECVVYGVLLEYCVRHALMGLLQRGRKVSLVTDATIALSEAAGRGVVENFVKQGGKCIDTSTALL